MRPCFSGACFAYAAPNQTREALFEGLMRAFEHFQAHYGFEAEFCSPGKGNEKGGVEGEVKYSRHEILSPIPEVDGRDDVQVLCGEWMERELSRTRRGREHTTAELWELERARLMPLPPKRFTAAQARTRRCGPTAR